MSSKSRHYRPRHGKRRAIIRGAFAESFTRTVGKDKPRRDHSDTNTLMRRITSADGKTEYGIMADGSRRRLSPLKPWRNKAERRRVVKARREGREKV